MPEDKIDECDFGNKLKREYEEERDTLKNKIEEINKSIECLTAEISGMKTFDREILQKFNDMMSMIIQLQNQVMELSKHIDNGWKQDLLDKLSNMVIDMAKAQSKFSNKMASTREANEHEEEIVKGENTTKLKLKKWEFWILAFGATGLFATLVKELFCWLSGLFR